MTETMSKRAATNYQNGLIYTIRERGTDNIFYVGSTCSLRKRRSAHKHNCIKIGNNKYHLDIYQYIRELGGWEMIIIEELHAFPCDTKQELTKEEGRVQKDYIGKGYKLRGQIAGRTIKEYKQDNKEKIAEQMNQYSKQYRLDNKEFIEEKRKQKVLCECGSNVRKGNISYHRKTKKHQKWLEQQQ